MPLKSIFEKISPKSRTSGGELNSDRTIPPKTAITYAKLPPATYPADNMEQVQWLNDKSRSHSQLNAGPFANASGFAINGQVNMIDVIQSDQTVMKILSEKAQPEAIHDSSYWQYGPQCNQNTRVLLRKEIAEWVMNPKRQNRVRWYMGPAAIGKSAIAQSTADELERIGHLGGSFFFSRLGKIDDPASVIPTFSYQLAMKIDDYKRIVAKLLTNDPLILTKNRALQFRKLIIEPFQVIMAARRTVDGKALVIILDGLDECRGMEAQCELAQLILDHAGRIKQFPLLWLLFSRPEWYLKSLVSDVDFPAACDQREISIEDAEAKADAKCIFEIALAKIRRQYRDFLPPDWPLKEDVDCLCKASSGHLGYVSFMARFIGDVHVGDPVKRLRICTRISSGFGVDQGTRINPLEALDLLYHRLLCDVPTDVLPTTLHIFSILLLFDMGNFQDFADFLCLDLPSLNGALKHLHSVISIPPSSKVSSEPVHFYHISFTEFLRDPVRSGKFHLSEGVSYRNVAVQCLRWLNEQNHRLLTADPEDPVLWFAQWVGWCACCKVPDEYVASLVDELASFNFGYLNNPHPREFAEFIHWLYTKVGSSLSPELAFGYSLSSTNTGSVRAFMPLVALFQRIRTKVKSSDATGRAHSNQHERVNTAPLTGQTNIYASSGVLSSPNNVLFSGQVNMYEINQTDHPAIQRLAGKAKPEAIHDSSFREYAPKCSVDTRVSIREDILRAQQQNWRRQGRLGGTFFFSRPGQIDDPDTVIPTLVYQLALMNDQYKRIISKILVGDPLLLAKNRATQFKKLIVEPFQEIMALDSSAIDNPLLIILDGLDECKGCEAQCELVQLILDHVRHFRHFPLVWLLLSRPEWHLKTLISDVDFPTIFEKREISVDDEEAIADARRIIEGELAKVQKQYPYLPSDWLAKEDVDRLCKAASGHLGYASFMARFISDKEIADPERQILICTRVASGLGVDRGTRINPLEALDCLYRRVLDDVPINLLPIAMKIFSTIQYTGLTYTRDLASFLLLTEGQLYQALRQLHAVIYVPPTNEATSQQLRFFHASFSDFLFDPIRSGKFHLSQGTMVYDLIVQSLRWMERHGDELSTDFVQVTAVARHCQDIPWLFCSNVAGSNLLSLMTELAAFDFGLLTKLQPNSVHFTYFIEWLLVYVSSLGLGTFWLDTEDGQAPENYLLVRLANIPQDMQIETLPLEYDFPKGSGWQTIFFPDGTPEEWPQVLHFLLGSRTRIHVQLTLNILK
ncbi:hypothetical protein NP233_g11896 [Leucocoprinus birnbaumii]|uniref:Nephrocystin 3-like N-terminal domain-containing protein n=1 Tax=Leucocoprinus birnbaumii TaxID=56174 RepID=A0AAD5VFG4_9AGAR|nr:hypothetical protein NP233_g11896 [Leucocoprinus birnbaumii]